MTTSTKVTLHRKPVKPRWRRNNQLLFGVSRATFHRTLDKGLSSTRSSQTLYMSSLLGFFEGKALRVIARLLLPPFVGFHWWRVYAESFIACHVPQIEAAGNLLAGSIWFIEAGNAACKAALRRHTSQGLTSMGHDRSCLVAYIMHHASTTYGA